MYVELKLKDMRLLVAVAAALVTLSAQAKVLECRLPFYEAEEVDNQTMRVKVEGDSVTVEHHINTPVRHETYRTGPREVLYHRHTEIDKFQHTFIAAADTYFPWLINIDWAKGTLRTTMPVADAWETRWECIRRD